MSFVPDVSIPKGAARRVAYFAAAVALLGLPSFAAAQWYNHGGGGGGDETFSVVATVEPPTKSTLNGFDISFVDASLGEYFLSDSTDKAILAINLSTKTPVLLGATAGFTGAPATCGVPHACNGPDGNFTVHDRNGPQIWAGNGNSDVIILSYPSGSLVKDLSTATPGLATNYYRADEGCWDPEDHLALVANDSALPAPYINFIRTDNYTIVKQIVFDGKSGPSTLGGISIGHGPNATNGIEQCQWNAREHAFYLNLPEVNGTGSDTADGNVVVINPHTLQIVQKFDIPVADCAGPQGMAIGPAPQILLGCNAKGPPNNTGPQNAAVMDEENGHLIKVLDNQGGNDEVWYNPGDGHYSLAEGSHATTDYLGIVDSQPIAVDQQIAIAPPPAAGSGPHSVAEDPIFNEIYLPIEAAVEAGASAQQQICPTAGVGCVAIFRSNKRDNHYVYRGH
ncbi:MAG: hypothetical protein WBD71_16435 [Xanthobacteraceae bacterium]